MNTIEKSYQFVFKNLKRAVNPVKKRILKAECRVHIFINNQAVMILKNDGHIEAYKLMSDYITDINAGAVWADQDLKSSNHFFNPQTSRGLFGNSNAMLESKSYYNTALREYLRDHKKSAMFFLGAACHLIQDLTVPQHANVRLLDNHRRFEKWIVTMYNHHHEFRVSRGGIYLRSLTLYVCLNSRKAIRTYKKYRSIENRLERFYKITSVILVMAQRTTAGLMDKFFRDIQRIRPVTIDSPVKQYSKKLLKYLSNEKER